MNQCPTAIRSATRRLLLRVCFGLFIFSAADGRPVSLVSAQPAGQGATLKRITIPLKVCVSDDEGRRVPVQPLLFNSPSNAVDVVKQRTNDGCYTSPPIKLNVGQVYFVAAMSEGRTAFSPFTVVPDDKEKTVSLKLAKQGGGSSADIEICAKDAHGNPLPITEIAPSSGAAQLTKKEVADPKCYRVSSAASGEYKLSLIAQSASSSPAAFSNNALGILGALLLFAAVAALVLTTFLFIRLRSLAPPLTAQQATVERIARMVDTLSAHIPVIRQRVEARLSATPPAGIQQTVPDQRDGTGASDTRDSVTDPLTLNLSKHTTTSLAPPSADASRQNRNFDDAKLKYRELSDGQTVEHFYLMPSGASMASAMVEDARIELLEQSNGTYVGFRSTVNEGEAMVFPMPNALFSPEAFKALFPALTAQDYESGNIAPRLAVNTQPGVWKVQ